MRQAPAFPLRTTGLAMPHLIDGHNLIPHAGLRLADPNDEAKLTAMLLRYFARTGRSGTVYFDGKASGAPPGGSSRHLTVRFVRRRAARTTPSVRTLAAGCRGAGLGGGVE